MSHLILGSRIALSSMMIVLLTTSFNYAKAPSKKFRQNATQQHSFAMEIKELRAIRGLLEKGDHDYKGHRVQAIKDITHAIHELEHKKANPGQGNTGKGGNKGKATNPGSGKQKEKQTLSDNQLREAVEGLQKVHQQLSQMQKHPMAAKAAGSVEAAINQLKDALVTK